MTEPFALEYVNDEQLWTEIMGKPTVARALFWCDREATDQQYNRSQLQEAIDVSNNSIDPIISRLVAFGVLERVSARDSRISLYEVNQTSPVLTEMNHLIRAAFGDY